MFQNGGHVCQFLCFKMADMFANSHVSKWRTCFSLQKQTTNLKLQTNMFANYTTRPKVSNGGQVCQLHKQTSSFKMVDMFVNYTNRPQVSKWRTSFQITVCKKQTTSLKWLIGTVCYQITKTDHKIQNGGHVCLGSVLIESPAD